MSPAGVEISPVHTAFNDQRFKEHKFKKSWSKTMIPIPQNKRPFNLKMATSNLTDLAFSESTSDLPIILCFHGVGTNGTIFEIQARSIIQSLKTEFNFLFLNAPFATLPGSGVAASFGDLKPYFRWHCDRLSAERFDIRMDDIERERMTVRALLLSKLEECGKHKIVGVMAFSQGARVATAFCLDEELGKNIKFAILIAGTFPILPLSKNLEEDRDTGLSYLDQHDLADFATSQIVDHQKEGPDTKLSYLSRRRIDQSPLNPVSRLQIPSIHVRGLRDPWLLEGDRLLKTYYDEDQALIVEFNGGHQVPMAKKDVSQITKGVMGFWEQIQQGKNGE